MYLSFYGLKENPFQISTNPRFLWLGEKHQEALATLRYGILDNKGFLLLTGDVGTGKTTLINALLASLDKEVLAATVPDPGLEQLDLYHFIATAFKLKGDFSSKGQFLALFSRFLHGMYAKGKKVLLIIDEAQRLSPAMLEEIRLLSNIERPEAKLINIFFVGQVEFNTILLREENRALRQRITVNFDIPPLTLSETAVYLGHRLKIAGAARSLFSKEAVQQIYLFSKGYPRLINVIADRSLLTGFVSEASRIGPAVVKECARELKISAPKPAVRKVESAQDVPAPQETQRTGQAAAEKGAGVAAKAVAAPVAEGKSISQPATKGGRDEAALPPQGPKEKSRFGALLSFLVGLMLLSAVAAGVCYFFFPDRMQGVMNEVQKRVISLVGKQSRLPSQGAVKKGAAPESGPKADPSAGKPVEAGTFGTKAGPAASAGNKVPSKAAQAEKAGSTAAGTGTVAGGKDAADQVPAAGPAVKEPPPAPAKEESKPVTVAAARPPAPAAGFGGHPLIIGFDYDSNNLSTYGIFMLNQLAKEVQARPYSKIVIRGYSDAMGADSYNENISLFRANIVKSYLLAKGVKADTIVTLGLGAKDPIASNDTIEGRRKNRRVEIEVQP